MSATKNFHSINLRDLEFENKVWKNKMDYLIHELEIHIHHIEAYDLEAEETGMQPLIDEGLLELNDYLKRAKTLKKRILIQEEEIPMYIKDFPMNRNHQLIKEHSDLEQDISHYLQEHEERIFMIRKSISGIFSS